MSLVISSSDARRNGKEAMTGPYHRLAGGRGVVAPKRVELSRRRFMKEDDDLGIDVP